MGVSSVQQGARQAHAARAARFVDRADARPRSRCCWCRRASGSMCTTRRTGAWCAAWICRACAPACRWSRCVDDRGYRQCSASMRHRSIWRLSSRHSWRCSWLASAVHKVVRWRAHAARGSGFRAACRRGVAPVRRSRAALIEALAGALLFAPAYRACGRAAGGAHLDGVLWRSSCAPSSGPARRRLRLQLRRGAACARRLSSGAQRAARIAGPARGRSRSGRQRAGHSPRSVRRRARCSRSMGRSIK